MFHVKHPEANPENIGRETRTLVERWVAEHAVDTLDPLFGQRIEKLASAIALWGSRMNLTAEPSDPAELAFHVLDSLAPLTLAAGPGGSVLRGLFAQDAARTGSGRRRWVSWVGPAAASPAQFVLADARRKRASFLTVTAGEMGLRNVQVQAAQLAPETVRSADKFAAQRWLRGRRRACLRSSGRVSSYGGSGTEAARDGDTIREPGTGVGGGVRPDRLGWARSKRSPTRLDAVAAVSTDSGCME